MGGGRGQGRRGETKEKGRGEAFLADVTEEAFCLKSASGKHCEGAPAYVPRCQSTKTQGI